MRTIQMIALSFCLGLMVCAQTDLDQPSEDFETSQAVVESLMVLSPKNTEDAIVPEQELSTPTALQDSKELDNDLDKLGLPDGTNPLEGFENLGSDIAEASRESQQFISQRDAGDQPKHGTLRPPTCSYSYLMTSSHVVMYMYEYKH